MAIIRISPVEVVSGGTTTTFSKKSTTKSVLATDLILNATTGLYEVIITHNLGINNFYCDVRGTDNKNRFVSTEKINLNTIKLEIDTRENLQVYISE